MTNQPNPADILQDNIIELMTTEDDGRIEALKDWFQFDRVPTEEYLVTCEPGTFVWCCRKLNILWWQLRETVRSAEQIPPEPIRKNHLRLVHAREPMLGSKNERTPENDRSGEVA